MMIKDENNKTASLQAAFCRLRANKAFELFVVVVIIFSALVIGAKTYELSSGLQRVVIVLDWMVTFIFLFEILIRFIGEPQKKRFFLNGWNVFDTLIVVVCLIPIDNSEMALVGRLVRIFRVLRMIAIIPALRVLLDSLLKALPQMGYVMLMIFIIFYIYAAIGSTFFAEINEVLWGDITISMLTLFRIMTFEDWTDIMYETMVVYPMSWVYYFSFICLTAFAFLNMVIGIVVSTLDEENAKIAKQEAEEAGEPSLLDLQRQIAELKALIEKR